MHIVSKILSMRCLSHWRSIIATGRALNAACLRAYDSAHSDCASQGGGGLDGAAVTDPVSVWVVWIMRVGNYMGIVLIIIIILHTLRVVHVHDVAEIWQVGRLHWVDSSDVGDDTSHHWVVGEVVLLALAVQAVCVTWVIRVSSWWDHSSMRVSLVVIMVRMASVASVCWVGTAILIWHILRVVHIRLVHVLLIVIIISTHVGFLSGLRADSP